MGIHMLISQQEASTQGRMHPGSMALHPKREAAASARPCTPDVRVRRMPTADELIIRPDVLVPVPEVERPLTSFEVCCPKDADRTLCRSRTSKVLLSEAVACRSKPHVSA